MPILQRSARDTSAAYELAGLLNNQVLGLSEDTIDNAVAFSVGVPVRSVRDYSGRLGLPKCSLHYCQDALVILINGLEMPATAAVVAVGYADGCPNNALGYQAAAQIGGDRLLDLIRTAPEIVPNRIVIAGHSWGGVIALYVASRMLSQNPDRAISVATYGSPKPGNVRVNGALVNIDYCRYMGVGDESPYIVPTRAESLLLYSLVVRTAARTFATYQQPGVGVVIGDMGDSFDRNLPPGLVFFRDLGVLEMLLRLNSPRGVAHSMGEYYRRLGLRDILALASLAVPMAIGFPDGLVLADRLAQQAAAAAPVAQVGGPAGQFFGLPGELPVSPRNFVLYPSGTSDPYYTQRINKISSVWYLDIMIAVCSGGKAARNLASSLNTAYRRWNRAKAGSAVALEFSVSEVFLD